MSARMAAAVSRLCRPFGNSKATKRGTSDRMKSVSSGVAGRMVISLRLGVRLGGMVDEMIPFTRLETIAFPFRQEGRRAANARVAREGMAFGRVLASPLVPSARDSLRAEGRDYP